MPRRLRILIAVLVFAVALALGWSRWQGGEGPAGDTLTLSGTVEASQVRSGFLVGGRIQAVAVEEGQAVRAGELIATLDDTDLRAALRQAEAERDAAAAALARLEAGSRAEEIDAAAARVEQMEARLDFAEREVERLRDLVGKGLAPPEQLDRALSEQAQARAALDEARARLALLRAGARKEDLAQARARLAAAEARLEVARLNLEHARLSAPVDAVVALRLAEPGDVVRAGQPVVELDVLSRPWVRAFLPEPDLSRVRLGQAVRVTLDGLPGVSLEGRLAFISPRAEFTPKTVETRELRVDLVYRIKVSVKDPEGRLKLGMPVDLHLSRS